MIQRIQSLFLLASTILSVILLVTPLSHVLLQNSEVLKLYSTGLRSEDGAGELVYNTLPIAILILITTILSGLALFLYSNRTVQMRLCVFNILLTIGLILLLFFYYFAIKNNFDVHTHSFSFTAIIPFVNILLLFQAFRAIRRDDLLVQSYDRLR